MRWLDVLASVLTAIRPYFDAAVLIALAVALVLRRRDLLPLRLCLPALW